MVLLIWLPGNNNDAVCAEIDAASVRLARSSDSSSYLSRCRSVLTNQSRVQDGLFYGCGDGLMDFEVPDAISAQAGTPGRREGERARGEATPERNFQGSRQPSQGKAKPLFMVAVAWLAVGRVRSNLQLVKLASPSPLSFRHERVETKFYRLQVPTPRQPKFTSSWGAQTCVHGNGG